jgi:membrane-associated protease RseP (regulator of RpoE activity)
MLPDVAWPQRQKFQDRGWLHVLLFMLTLVTTTLVGADLYASFLVDFARETTLPLPVPALVLRGFWYSGTVLAILGAHEMGHYLACRYYDVDASLPFFIPFPVPFFTTGTLGAVIRIREPIRHKRALFDIGIAGPIAGFVVTVPALVIGLAMSHVARVPADFAGMALGEPLLLKGVSWLLFGAQPDGYSLNLHPMAFAAWFGMLATALNLFPVGQLDGGHISYSVFGPRSTYGTFLMMAVAVVLSYNSSGLLVWTVAMAVMLIVFGPRHPRVLDEAVPLDRRRMALALFALVMFALCFTPAPISLIGH